SDGNHVEYTVITDVDALQAISEDLSGHYVLGSDIDASATAGWNCDEWCLGFAPIGNSSNAFTGTFDGLGHVIEGLAIDRPSSIYVGLFGFSSGAAVRHAGLADANIFGNRFVGALVGYAAGTEIRHMHVTGDVMGYDHVGGLVGIAGGSIHDSYAMGTVTGLQRVGGLVGASGGEILRSFASAEVRGGSGAPTDESIGGLVGYQFSGSIGQSYAVGTVSDAYQ